jgi:hypothetical protein
MDLEEANIFLGFLMHLGQVEYGGRMRGIDRYIEFRHSMAFHIAMIFRLGDNLRMDENIMR